MEKSILRYTIGAVLATVSALANGAGWASVQESLRIYERLDAEMIVWGKEKGTDQPIAVLDPPLFTGSGDRVEVLEFVRYPQKVWLAAERLAKAWRESLPEEVVVRRIPLDLDAGPFGQRGNWKALLREQQRLYFAAEQLGIEDVAHRALQASGERGDKSIGRALSEVVSNTNLNKGALDALRKGEFVRMRGMEASELYRSSLHAHEAVGMEEPKPWRFPELIVNGRYAISGSRIGDPVAAYRLANRLIREELSRERSEKGPATDEEFHEWMEARSGQILRQVAWDEEREQRLVYSSARGEMWGLSSSGNYLGAYRLIGEEERSYYRLNKGSTVRYWSYWRFGRQLASFERTDGSVQRYGAFVLMDFLCAPDTHWVQLRFGGRKTALAFDQCEHGEGRVEGRNANGSVFGSWWLEAGELKVAFASEVGSESWPWREVAKQVGWKIPRESLTPWRFRDGEREDRGQTVAREAGRDR